MQTQDKKIVDLKSIDTVKAFLTLSVLIYHSILAWSVFGWHSFSVRRFPVFAYLCDFLLKFHTPAFTFLSGYLFYYLRYEKGKYRNRKKDIANRAKRLLLPYAVMLLWVTPFHFLFEAGTIQKVLLKYILVVAPSQLWYLIMLFGVFVIFHFISDRLQKHPLVNFIVFYGIYGCATVLAMVLPDYFQCWTILKSLLFFYFGYAVRQGVFKGLMKNARNIYIYIRMSLQRFDFCGLPLFVAGRIFGHQGVLCGFGPDYNLNRYSNFCSSVFSGRRQCAYKIKSFWLGPAI